jgi:hypothetical protein
MTTNQTGRIQHDLPPSPVVESPLENAHGTRNVTLSSGHVAAPEFFQETGLVQIFHEASVYQIRRLFRHLEAIHGRIGGAIEKLNFIRAQRGQIDIGPAANDHVLYVDAILFEEFLIKGV